MFIIPTYRINRNITRNIWLLICCLDTRIREDYRKPNLFSIPNRASTKYYVLLEESILISYYQGFQLIGVNFEQDGSSFRAIIGIETGFILAI